MCSPLPIPRLCPGLLLLLQVRLAADVVGRAPKELSQEVVRLKVGRGEGGGPGQVVLRLQVAYRHSVSKNSCQNFVSVGA